MNTLTEKYNATRQGTFSKEQFLRDARLAHPRLVTQFNSFEDAVSILKSKSMLFEEELPKYKPEKTPTHNYEANTADMFPIEAIERGIDAELEEKGLDSSLTPSEEDYIKAREKAISNIEKDVLFYLKKLTGEKTPTKRKDVMTPVGKDNLVDKDNGMKQVKLNEMAIAKDLIKNLIKKALNEESNNNISNKRRFLSEALNKNLKIFREELQEKLKAAGFEIKTITVEPKPDQQQELNSNPKLAYILFVEDPDMQILKLYINPKTLTRAQSVVDKFQLSTYKGPEITRGSVTKQVVGNLNPGDISRQDTNLSKGIFTFYRMYDIDRQVLTKNKKITEQDQSTEESTPTDSRPAQSDQEAKIKARNALNNVLPLLDSNMNLEDIADPSVLDMFLEALKDEILSRTEMDNIAQPDLNENRRRRFTFKGKIL